MAPRDRDRAAAAGLRAEIGADLKTQLLARVAAGRDVVLDPRGRLPVTDRASLLARERACSGAHPDDHVLPDGLAASHYDDLEPPGDHEGPLTVLG